MPCWYYDKKDLRNTPSALDNISYETELRYRQEGARFIIDTGTKMDLGYNTMATGVVYFHRFYMFHSFKSFPRYVTACCCLFLAGKTEETPKKCRDIINSAKHFLSEHKFSTFGENPKEEVMTLERILLQTIKFDLLVEHPYHYLLKYAKCLNGDKAKLHKMVQMAWTFVNDSLCTTLCLQWEPEIIAVALMYLAGKLSKFEVVDWSGRQAKHCRWWDMFIEGVTMDLLEDICHQVLDLYSQQSAGEDHPDSPPPSRAAFLESSRNEIANSISQSPALPPTKMSSKSELKASRSNGESSKVHVEAMKPPTAIEYPFPAYSAAPPPLYSAPFAPPQANSAAPQFFLAPAVTSRPTYYPPAS